MPYRLFLHAGGRLGWLRGATGAVVGLLFAAAIAHLLLGNGAAGYPLLLAPMGASAVLVFSLPASPLAQPWSLIGGDLLSAVVGLVVGQIIPDPLVAAPVAVGAAIATMSLCRCLHPPGGACALLGAMGGPAIKMLGWPGLLLPLAINVLALAAAAWLYNTVTGHRWPHRQTPSAPLPPTTWAGTYEEADLDAVLEDWDEVLDVSREDLDALFREVERRVLERWQAGR